MGKTNRSRPGGDLCNRAFAETQFFQNLCEQADTPVTKRQASKYRNAHGKVWKRFKNK